MDGFKEDYALPTVEFATGSIYKHRNIPATVYLYLSITILATNTGLYAEIYSISSSISI